ncbi:MAG: tyrosine-type recombinase/integrase [Solirubrobacteraceae bacterium]
MDPLLAGYDTSRLAHLSHDRRQTALRVLGQLQDWLGVGGLTSVNAGALSGFLAGQLADGLSPGTVRKHRALVLAFYEWAYEEGCYEAGGLLALRTVRPPAGASREAHPEPYKRWELRALQKTLDERWPKLPEEEAYRWLGRVREGRSPYARVRSHASRCHLDAIIALALHTGLRRDELFNLSVPYMHYDNEDVVVRDKTVPGRENRREVPFTCAARDAIEQWIACRSFLDPDHERSWLNLHAETTMRDPMKRGTFDKLLATYVGPGWTLKRLRDTCAAGWVRSGLPLEHLRQLLGLSTIHEVLPYARLVKGSLDGRVEELDTIFTDLVLPAEIAA